MQNIMLDMETMGHHSDAAIVSIGAVKFDLETGKTGEEFYRDISLKSCTELGLTIDAETVMWWLKQNYNARKKIVEGHNIAILKALQEFQEFCDSKNFKIWANSPSFDCVILRNAYNKAKMFAPWQFWNERDVRTLAALKPQILANFPDVGVAHNAIDDCKYQIGYCSKIHNTLQ